MPTQGEHSLGELPVEIREDGTLARKFRLERTLGSGGMAVVLAAHHLALDQRVALKLLLPEATRSKAAVARFRKEARAAAMIKNEHVVRILDVAVTGSGLPYIVMEHLDGRDLEHLLQNATGGRLPIPDAIDFVLQASEALAEGHRLGIVHRDLKPANLFCVDREDGHPMIKVLDFGISKVDATVGEVERTDRWEILGSPRYMSPEQIDSARDVDLRSDIWSLGVVLYQAISGRVPFGGELVPDLWHKIHGETPRRLSELRQGVSEVLERVVMRCLEKEPARRYADLGEFATALAGVAPERSQESIARIVRTTGNPSTPAPGSFPAITTDKTLAARYRPRGSAYRMAARVVSGFVAGLLALSALLLLRPFPGLVEERGRLAPERSAVPASEESSVHSFVEPAGAPDGLRSGSEAPPLVLPEAAGSAEGLSTPTARSPRRWAPSGVASATMSATATMKAPSALAESSPRLPPAATGVAVDGLAPILRSAAPAVTATLPATFPWFVPPVQERRKPR